MYNLKIMTVYIEKSQALLDDLSVIIQESSSLELRTQFEPIINNCENFIKAPNQTRSIPILFLGIPNEEEVKLLESYFEQKLATDFITRKIPYFLAQKQYDENRINLQFWDATKVGTSFFEERKTIVLVFLFEPPQRNKDLLQAIRLLTERNGVLYFYTRHYLPKNDKSILSKTVGRLIAQQIVTLEGQHLSSDFTQLMSSENKAVYQALMGIEEISNINRQFLSAHEQHRLHLKIKKMQLMQKQIQAQRKTKKNQRNGSQLERVVNLRLRQFEQRFSNALEENLKPTLGRFCMLASQEIETLEDLKEIKRAKQLAFTIPEDTLDNIMKTFKTNCENLIHSQKKEAIKCNKTIHREISKFLAQYNLKPIQSSTEIIEDREIQYLLQHKIVFDKKFEGAMSNRGLMEYIMGARMYFMYVMMGASMLGYSIRRNETLKQYMASIAIILIGLGVYQVWSSKQGEREEQTEKHLQGAKDFINNQFKRISQEINRAMEKLIAEKVRKQAERSIVNAQQLLQTKLELEQKKLEIQKNKIDRMLKSMAAQEKKMDTLARSQANFEKNIERLKNALQSNIKQKERIIPTEFNSIITPNVDENISDRESRRLERMERKRRRAERVED